jgi:hypothetical protein
MRGRMERPWGTLPRQGGGVSDPTVPSGHGEQEFPTPWNWALVNLGGNWGLKAPRQPFPPCGVCVLKGRETLAGGATTGSRRAPRRLLPPRSGRSARRVRCLHVTTVLRPVLAPFQGAAFFHGGNRVDPMVAPPTHLFRASGTTKSLSPPPFPLPFRPFTGRNISFTGLDIRFTGPTNPFIQTDNRITELVNPITGADE